MDITVTSSPPVRSLPLAHGWKLQVDQCTSREAVRDYIQPAVRAVPRTLSRHFRRCDISLVEKLDEENEVSSWTATEDTLSIAVAMPALDPHDAAIELLVCLGQALWEQLEPSERAEWLTLLNGEIQNGVTGEIDEDALLMKERLMLSSTTARSRRRLQDYAQAAFAGTLAEYVHALWHNVTIRVGPSHLPARWLRKRLDLMLRWFPPGHGQKLFAERPNGRQRRLRRT
jgi:hypothetical protein